MWRSLWVIASVWLLVGCAAGMEEPAPATVSVIATPVVSAPGATPMWSVSPVSPLLRPTATVTLPRSSVRSQEEQVARAVADLAERLAVPAGRIEVVRVDKTEMPLGDLGCPGAKKPVDGQAPAIVMGTRIVLGVDERVVVYHARLAQVEYCGTQ